MRTLDEGILKDKILHRLGHKLVKVELEDEDWDEIFDDSYRWWVSRKGLIKRYPLTLTPGLTEYDMPEDFKALYEYVPSGGGPGASSNDVIDPFAYENVYSYQSSNNFQSISLMTNVALTNQYSEMLSNVLGNSVSVWVDTAVSNDSTAGARLYVHPSPLYAANSVVYYTSENFEEADLVKLSGRDQELFIMAVEGMAKRILGRKRMKFSDLQVPGVSVTLDGQTLLDEAQTIFDTLEEAIIDSQWPVPFVTG